MSWKPDMENNGDFEMIGFNVTFIEFGSAVIRYTNRSRINDIELFVDQLKPYTTYQLNVSGFNRFGIYSPISRREFITCESGNNLYCIASMTNALQLIFQLKNHFILCFLTYDLN